MEFRTTDPVSRVLPVPLFAFVFIPSTSNSCRGPRSARTHTHETHSAVLHRLVAISSLCWDGPAQRSEKL